MDRLCLHPVFIHRQNKAAIQQFFVDVDRRGRQKNHHRTFDPVLMRDVPSAHRVFAGAGDGQLTLALQQLQGVGRALRARLLHDGQHLVL